MISNGQLRSVAKEVAHFRKDLLSPQPRVADVAATEIFRQREHPLCVVLHVFGASDETLDAYGHGLVRGWGAHPKIFPLCHLAQLGLREERPALSVKPSYQFGVLEDYGIVRYRLEARE